MGTIKKGGTSKIGRNKDKCAKYRYLQKGGDIYENIINRKM